MYLVKISNIFTIPKKIAHKVNVLRNCAADPDLRFLDHPPFLPALAKPLIPFWVSSFLRRDKPEEFLPLPRPCLQFQIEVIDNF